MVNCLDTEGGHQGREGGSGIRAAFEPKGPPIVLVLVGINEGHPRKGKLCFLPVCFTHVPVGSTGAA